MHSQWNSHRDNLADINIKIFQYLRNGLCWADRCRWWVPLASRVSPKKLKLVISRAGKGDHCVTVNIKIVGM
jgi:hypothetical protein